MLTLAVDLGREDLDTEPPVGLEDDSLREEFVSTHRLRLEGEKLSSLNDDCMRSLRAIAKFLKFVPSGSLQEEDNLRPYIPDWKEGQMTVKTGFQVSGFRTDDDQSRLLTAYLQLDSPFAIPPWYCGSTEIWDKTYGKQEDAMPRRDDFVSRRISSTNNDSSTPPKSSFYRGRDETYGQQDEIPRRDDLSGRISSTKTDPSIPRNSSYHRLRPSIDPLSPTFVPTQTHDCANPLLPRTDESEIPKSVRFTSSPSPTRRRSAVARGVK